MRKINRLFLLLTFAATTSASFGQSGIGPITTSVANANQRVGHPPTIIADGFQIKTVTKGEVQLENPSGLIYKFGYLNDFPPQLIEATKTEPDENTYLVMDNPGGPTPNFDYGRHFLFQGHENSHDLAYITRVNLDVHDPAHRITLLTPPGDDGLTHFNSIDGSTYNPFTHTLLFTQETSFPIGGVIQVTTSWPPVTNRLDGILGSSAYEGVHPDDRGNILLQEDAGGVSVNVDPFDPDSPKAARQPNSFVFRFLPYDISDLSQGGKLQALQVFVDGEPLVFHADDPVGDVFSVKQKTLRTPGTSYPVRWVTVHDTAVDGFEPFNANAAAKAALATPFKRPENSQFAPGSKFRTFFFDETGDTSADSGNRPELAARGAWGSLFRVDLTIDRNSGLISIFAMGDAVHAAFDNLTFADANTLLAGEDRGDTLHKQLNTLDSIWAFPLDGSPALRFVALGRDLASEIDAAYLDQGTQGFQNEGDNETTGVHVSAGSITTRGMPGTMGNLINPRAFFTQQHGYNTLYRIAYPKK
jgi:hypothetical protein